MDKRIATHYFSIKNANSSQYLGLMKDINEEDEVSVDKRRVTKKRSSK